MSKIGTEILVNTQKLHDQALAQTAKLLNGGFVTVWVDWSVDWDAGTADSSQSGIKAQVFSSSGNKVDTEILVNTATLNWQHDPQVAVLQNGNFVVTWTDGLNRDSNYHPGSAGVGGATGDTQGNAIKAQVFSAGGSPIGTEIRVNTEIRNDQISGKITALGNGNFVVAWEDWSTSCTYAADGSLSYCGGGPSIKAQMFDSVGGKIGAELAVAGEHNSWPQMTALVNGGFVLVWTDGHHSVSDVRAQVFSATATKVGAEILVNTNGAGATHSVQHEQKIVALVNGGFVVTWTDNNGDGIDGQAGMGIKAQVFDATGVMVGAEIHVNTEIDSMQALPELAALKNGGFVVAWENWGGDSIDVNAQIFDSAGVRIGSEILLNTNTASIQQVVRIAALEDGGFAASWWDYYGSWSGYAGAPKLQVFDASGVKVGPEQLVNTTPAVLSASLITALDNGEFVVGWNTSDGSGRGVAAQIFDNVPPDTSAPTVTTFGPLDEAINVPVISNIVVTFNEAIARGTGNILLKTATGTTFATYDAASSSNLSISGSVLTLNPSADLSAGTAYKVEFAAGSIKDLAGNNYAGTTSYNFTTASGSVSSDDYSADTGTTGYVSVGGSLSGTIETSGDHDWIKTYLYADTTYSISLSGVEGGGGTLGDPVINAVHNSAGTAISGASNDDSGIGNDSLLSFAPAASGYYYVAARGYSSSTGSYTLSITSDGVAPEEAPTAIAFGPADEATGVAVDSNIVVTFSEAIARGTGSIVLKTSTGSTVATYDAATSSNLSISGSTLTLNPTADLSAGIAYWVEFVAGSVKDLAGNSYAGTTSYNFTTASGTPTPDGTLTKAKIYLGADGDIFTVSNSGATVYGNSGLDVVTVASGVHHVTLDQNVEKVVFLNASGSYAFKQTGNKINVYDATGSTLLTSLPVQGDADGTVLTFSNGSASAKLSAGVMTLGLATVSSAAATTLLPFGITTVDISGAGSSSAAASDQTFILVLGNYTHTISGFAAGDKLDFPAGNVPSVDNYNFGDGQVDLTYSSGGSSFTIRLTGLASSIDQQLTMPADFNAVFGAGTIF